MKQLLSIATFLLLIVNPIKADFVPVDKAQTVAAGVFGKNTQKSSSTISLLYVGTCGADTVYYVFGQADGGFAIISADDAVNPVLGFSHTSPASEPIENKMLMHQLNRYGQKISAVRQSGIGSSANHRKWRARADSTPNIDTVPTADSTQVIDTISIIDTVITVGPLLTSAWEQRGAYNDSCPSFAGCVAVAMGQIMRYHRWPETGRGWHKYVPSENPEIGQQVANFGATTYHWDLMPDKLSRQHSAAEKSAVAQLLRHAGVAVDMSYTKNGSGSYTCDVLYAMPHYFRYSDSISMCTYANFSVDGWFNIIKAEIDAGRPVIYSGATSRQEGHAWVVDGYNTDGYLHINWGWGGDYDGFFLPDKMILESAHFDREIDAIIGIRPAGSNALLWTMQSSGFEKSYRGIQNISAVDELTVWASAYDASESNGQCMDFSRTIDGGESWQAGTVNIAKNESYTISSISAVSALEAWASVFVCVNSSTLTGGKIAHTTNGGQTWTVQPSATFNGKSAFPNAVHFWDSRTGVCIGDPNGGYFEIYTTTDGGNQWTRVPSSRIPASKRDETGIIGSFAVCGNTVFFGTSAGRLFRSIDRGATWTVATTPFQTDFKLAFRNNEVGVISALVSNKYIAYHTADGGSSWERLPASNKFFATSFAYIPGTDTLVCVGNNSQKRAGLAFSTDNGATFRNFADFYTDLDTYTAIGIEPGGKGMWAGALNYNQYYGGMWHRGTTPFVRRNTFTSVGQADSVMPKPLVVYPNPAADAVTIASPEPIGTVELISPQGIVVKRIAADSRICTLPIANLPKGIYLVRATMGGGPVRFGRVVKR